VLQHSEQDGDGAKARGGSPALKDRAGSRATREKAPEAFRAAPCRSDEILPGRVRGALLRSFVQFFFQPVAFSEVYRVNLLELVQQLPRHRCVVTVTFLFGDDLALLGNMPLAFGDVAPSLFQMIEYGSPVHRSVSGNARWRPAVPIARGDGHCGLCWFGLSYSHHRQRPTGVGG
jgi:hypothetical protein